MSAGGRSRAIRRPFALAALVSVVATLALAGGCSRRVAQGVPLAGPYEDSRQAEITFGQRSYYLSPWRAYMDTWPAARFLECLGVGFNCGREPRAAAPLAQALAECGIRSARIEIGWGSMAWDDPGVLAGGAARTADTLRALRRHGIRPLILLNAHHGVPCPTRWFDAELKRDANQGERAIVLADTQRVRVGYTGLTNLAGYRAAFPLIVAVDAGSGRCELSAPLPVDLKAGKATLSEIRFRPFSGAVFADGSPNPASQETVDGWLQYVAGVCRFARDTLGTAGAADTGFDLEVWNEYTFGSDFLDLKRYYDPDQAFAEPLTYRNHGRTAKGSESILPMVVDYVNDPGNGFPGVNVISGFANQRPWDSGSGMWPGQAGISRHYYTGLDPYSPFNGNAGALSPEQPDAPRSGPLNALGVADGTLDGKDWHTVLPGSFFVPTLQVAMPESWFFGYKTEFITRDVQPFPSSGGGPISFAGHHRYSHPGTGRPGQVWQTEFNADRSAFAAHVMRESGCTKDDPRLLALLHAVGAKATLRTFVFQSHKGIHTVNLFATYFGPGGDHSLAIVPPGFFAALKAADYELTDAVRAHLGPQLTVVGRVARLMRGAAPIAEARPLRVDELLEEQPQLVFRGDGTPAHPDRWHRDDFACLPYQLAADHFAIAYYVVTRNMVKDWDKAREPLDPRRYDMPEQGFVLTIGNLRGRGAKVSVYDPIQDRECPVEVFRRGPDRLTVRLPTVDYPRFLLVREKRVGPLVLAPRLEAGPAGGARLRFRSNVDGVATVSVGPFPKRVPAAPSPRAPLTVKAGREVTVELPETVAGDAVRVTLTAGGLHARWPRWDWDVQGVLGFGGGPPPPAR